MDTESKIRLFTLANSITENLLDKIEKKFDIDLKRNEKEIKEEKEYYAQFEANYRKEAKVMSKYYELFYCLERSTRNLVTQLMFEKFGANWWDTNVDQPIKDNVELNIKRERDSSFTERSDEKIEYTTFGELGQIATSNWDAFDGLFKSKSAFQKIMTNLNHLRGPIAHCCPLAEDEIARLEITVKDWFRAMDYK
ncbi:MAG: Swt1 family HEPN domain-containing protein [Patescibacteria group bacterium]|nr:Swt1 family HEPN domain-containing protein [Patescibacteria group bacterium]MDD4610379.1 Swt1 family HEPN domain-containing protein [Patescibacteria group bacterium]